jgi:hypothetical protein
MSDYFRRFRGRVDRRHIARAKITIVGCGRVGGQLALEVARLVPGHLVLVDGDDLELGNLSGHPLPSEYLHMNKAVALCDFLQREIPGNTEFTAIPNFVDDDRSDEQIIADLIEDSAVVIVATDDLETQRRVAGLARLAEVPAIVPGIAADGRRAEAFLSLSEVAPCLECFDGFREPDAPVRAAAVTAPDGYPAIGLAFALTLAVLDPNSREAAELLTPLRPGGPVPQLFRAWPPGAPELAAADDGRTEVAWRADCPGCGGRRPPVLTLRQRVQQRREQRRAEWTGQLWRRPLPRWLVWTFYICLLIFLVASGASWETVKATMIASLLIGAGIWVGRRLPREPSRP